MIFIKLTQVILIFKILICINANQKQKDSICSFQNENFTKSITLNLSNPIINIWLIKDFNSFADLNFIDCSHPVIAYYWKLQPNTKLLINNQLTFSNGSNTLKILSLYDTINIYLSNIYGFDLKCKNPFQDIVYEYSIENIYKSKI